MKFILLEDSNQISICKYPKSKVKLSPAGITIFGKDITAAKLRLPARNSTVFVPAKQIAEYTNYVYFPEDQIETVYSDLSRKYTQPVTTQEMSKWQWLQIKDSHPYTGK